MLFCYWVVNSQDFYSQLAQNTTKEVLELGLRSILRDICDEHVHDSNESCWKVWLEMRQCDDGFQVFGIIGRIALAESVFWEIYQSPCLNLAGKDCHKDSQQVVYTFADNFRSITIMWNEN